MEQIKLKTNIKCSGCIASVTPFLDEALGQGNWNVNVADPSKVLTVNLNKEKQEDVIKAVEKAGYKAEAL